MNENGDSKIEDIKRRLYEREDTVSSRPREGMLHSMNYKVSSDWQGDSNSNIDSMKIKRHKKSIVKKFFVVAILFFLGAIGFASYMFFSDNTSVSSENIDITVLGNAFTKGGDELPLQIEITNRNKANLELVNLIVEYPKGANDNTNDVIRLPKDYIGTIKPGESVIRNVKVVLFGEERLSRKVKVTLEYHPESSNAIFIKEKEHSVTISSAPLFLTIESPVEITSDQPISFKINATLNTTLPDNSTILQVTYPNNFIYENAMPVPSYGNSSWDLSKLSLTEPMTITINGKFIGQEGDQQVLHVYAGSANESNKAEVEVVYNSLLQTVTITKPFLETKILVNGQDLSNPTATSLDTVRVGIAWANNLPTLVTDGQIIATVTGNALDRATINARDGFYNSLNNQIIWDKNTTSDLVNIDPGASGVVEFDFKPISLVGSSSGVKDPQIEISVSIKGRQPSLGSTFSDINNFIKKIVKINSDFQIAPSASYSSGAMPPKVGVETKYLITWSLSNSVNTINQAQAKSVLPVYVKWVGLKSGSKENVTYNEVTREVIWNIGTVHPNTGIDSNKEVSFILSITPSLSQVGSVPQLMKDVYLTGQDSFANILIKNKRNPITTLLLNEPTFIRGNERVVN